MPPHEAAYGNAGKSQIHLAPHTTKGNEGGMHDDDSNSSSDIQSHQGRDSVPVRPEGSLDNTPGTRSNASGENNGDSQRDPLAGVDFDQIKDNPVVLAKITAHLQQNHLHLPVLTPDIDVMLEMREKTPEMYELYVSGIAKAIDADYIQRTVPYTEPARLVQSGRKYGFAAVIAVLFFAGFALYLDRAVLAGIIAAIDVVALAAVFASGDQPDNKNDS